MALVADSVQTIAGGSTRATSLAHTVSVRLPIVCVMVAGPLWASLWNSTLYTLPRARTCSPGLCGSVTFEPAGNAFSSLVGSGVAAYVCGMSSSYGQESAPLRYTVIVTPTALELLMNSTVLAVFDTTTPAGLPPISPGPPG